MSSKFWRDDALCKQVGGDFWFPEDGPASSENKDARKMCFRCPVQSECLILARRTSPRHGIWGGLGVREIERLNRVEGKP